MKTITLIRDDGSEIVFVLDKIVCWYSLEGRYLIIITVEDTYDFTYNNEEDLNIYLTELVSAFECK